MNATRKTGAVLVGAVALSALLYQRSILSAARSENRMLRSEQEKALRLTPGDPARTQPLPEIVELEKLRAETRDLHRLRNEIRQLREKKPDLEKLRAENLNLRTRADGATGVVAQTSSSGPLLAKESLADSGLNTPEAALQTFFWAVREKNAPRLRACLAGDNTGGLREQSDEELLSGPGSMMDTFQDCEIVAKKVVSADEVKLGVRVRTRSDGAAASAEMSLPFKRVGTQWKLALGQL